MIKKIFLTKNSDETKNLAGEIGKDLKDGGVLALFGNLGSGKTTFVQGLAKSLGIKERIISPTFIIIRKYKVSNTKYQVSNFYHVDLYRVQNDRQIEEELKEIFSSKNGIVAIEWTEKLEKLPKRRIEIYFEHISENERKITIKKYG